MTAPNAGNTSPLEDHAERIRELAVASKRKGDGMVLDPPIWILTVRRRGADVEPITRSKAGW